MMNMMDLSRMRRSSCQMSLHSELSDGNRFNQQKNIEVLFLFYFNLFTIISQTNDFKCTTPLPLIINKSSSMMMRRDLLKRKVFINEIITCTSPHSAEIIKLRSSFVGFECVIKVIFYCEKCFLRMTDEKKQ